MTTRPYHPGAARVLETQLLGLQSCCSARVHTSEAGCTMRIFRRQFGQTEYLPCSSFFKGVLSAVRDPSST